MNRIRNRFDVPCDRDTHLVLHLDLPNCEGVFDQYFVDHWVASCFLYCASATSILAKGFRPLPEEIRQCTQENLLPPRAVAPLVRELAKLPEPQQEDLRKVLRDEPELDRIKDVTSTARWITKATESGVAVRAFQQGELDLEKAMQEAQRLDALGLLADAVGQAQALEAAVLKLHTSWRRLGGLQERLWVESGSSTPYLRDVLNALQSLSGATLRVSLGELAGGKNVRLQLVEEAPDQLEPPPLP